MEVGVGMQTVPVFTQRKWEWDCPLSRAFPAKRNRLILIHFVAGFMTVPSFLSVFSVSPW